MEVQFFLLQLLPHLWKQQHPHHHGAAKGEHQRGTSTCRIGTIASRVPWSYRSSLFPIWSNVVENQFRTIRVQVLVSKTDLIQITTFNETLKSDTMLQVLLEGRDYFCKSKYLFAAKVFCVLTN